MLSQRVVGLGVGLALVMVGGCASAPPRAPLTWLKPAVAARPEPRGCVEQSRYTERDVSKILELRDEGESLKDVAKEVGGSRLEVKCAEHSAISHKREARYVQNR